MYLSSIRENINKWPGISLSLSLFLANQRRTKITAPRSMLPRAFSFFFFDSLRLSFSLSSRAETLPFGRRFTRVRLSQYVCSRSSSSHDNDDNSSGVHHRQQSSHYLSSRRWFSMYHQHAPHPASEEDQQQRRRFSLLRSAHNAHTCARE